jgi:hypothetical protein
LAEDFELPEERKRADAVMNRYLKDALCLLDKGHKWYVGLAEQYELRDAKRYIEGFYATVHGTVELKTSKGRKPARGATVTIRDPHDGTTWRAVTNNQGQYEISKAILHDKCSPFDIAAEWKGSRSEKTYTGALEKPDPGKRHKVDLLLVPSITGKIRFQCTFSSKAFELSANGNNDHTVPFSVDFSTDPPSIRGEGTYRSTLNSQSGTLTGGVATGRQNLRRRAERTHQTISRQKRPVQLHLRRERLSKDRDNNRPKSAPWRVAANAVGRGQAATAVRHAIKRLRRRCHERPVYHSSGRRLAKGIPSSNHRWRDCFGICLHDHSAPGQEGT